MPWCFSGGGLQVISDTMDDAELTHKLWRVYRTLMKVWCVFGSKD